MADVGFVKENFYGVDEECAMMGFENTLDTLFYDITCDGGEYAVRTTWGRGPKPVKLAAGRAAPTRAKALTRLLCGSSNDALRRYSPG